MKKEKNQMRNSSSKNEQDFRSRSHSPKAYLGCDTCKFKYSDLKKVKSTSKLSDCSNGHDKARVKKSFEKNDQEVKEQKIKLVDLCEEDKKRIVELIEELTRLSDKNLHLREALERAQKDWREQQEYLKKQSNSLMDEKNFYINEINEYKIRVEGLENELKSKLTQWKNESRSKDNEKNSLAKALQKSLAEKNELQEQINHLKICLKHSLESFQKLRNELTTLSSQEGKKFRSLTTQTESVPFKGLFSVTEEETEDEDVSTGTEDMINPKSSLDIINDKLEYVYQLLKRKSDELIRSNSKKQDVDLLAFIKNQMKLTDGSRTEDSNANVSDDANAVGGNDDDKFGDGYKFLKPFDQCSRTSVQAQRILKTLGKPLSLVLKDRSQKLDGSNLDVFKSKENLIGNACSTILQNKIIQKNNLFKSAKEHQYVEDRLLEDLFYSDQGLNVALGCQTETAG